VPNSTIVLASIWRALRYRNLPCSGVIGMYASFK